MQEAPRQESRNTKWLKFIAKIAVTAICLWYVSGKIDFASAGEALRKADWLLLLPAVLAFIVSKWLAAVRLNIYFRDIDLHLPGWQNVKLYWLGMYYNLFLPGSISGDAYKVVLLTKKYGVSYKKTMSAVLLDRLSGLLGLMIILACYGTVVSTTDLQLAACIGIPLLAGIALYLVTRFWLRDFRASFWPTLFWGLAVQVMQVICVYLIMMALQIPVDRHEYIFLFLLSSIVAVLPLTIGGLGAREIVFLEGSAYFGLAREHSVVISLIFYLITLLVSSWGLVYVFRNPLIKKDGVA